MNFFIDFLPGIRDSVFCGILWRNRGNDLTFVCVLFTIKADMKWGNDNGQAKFTLELSKVNRSQLKVVVSFNTNISNGWGGNSSASVSGSQLTLTWYEAPETAEIFVQADSNLNSLKITGATYSNK